jgi:hypothetical protein
MNKVKKGRIISILKIIQLFRYNSINTSIRGVEFRVRVVRELSNKLIFTKKIQPMRVPFKINSDSNVH